MGLTAEPSRPAFTFLFWSHLPGLCLISLGGTCFGYLYPKVLSSSQGIPSARPFGNCLLFPFVHFHLHRSTAQPPAPPSPGGQGLWRALSRNSSSLACLPLITQHCTAGEPVINRHSCTARSFWNQRVCSMLEHPHPLP